MSLARTFLDRLRNAGITDTDNEEQRLQKSLLFFATGLICLASVVWLLLYWQLGPRFPSNLSFALQLLLVRNLLVYLKTLNFNVFRSIQLSLFLFTPFVAQWSIGSFITASGISLWALLAPIGAVLFIGPRESGAWFFAYVFLTALSGGFDYYLADSLSMAQHPVPPQTTAFFFALNFAAVSAIVYVLLCYADSQKHQAQQRLQEAHRLLQNEQDRSERLLLNILPASIARRLKNGNQTIADGFSEISVMFADIVSFTRVAEGLTPQQVFAMLNKIFSCFDELAEKYGLEKIKTIGDAYLAAGGLPDPLHGSPMEVVKAALEMQSFMDRHRSEREARGKPVFEMRVGIHTGPVVAGIVGVKKFAYDIWGDTVSTTSYLESNCEVGQVNISQSTYALVKDAPGLSFALRGRMEVKGRGEMEMYFVSTA